jgi:hypothetical protein
VAFVKEVAVLGWCYVRSISPGEYKNSLLKFIFRVILKKYEGHFFSRLSTIHLKIDLSTLLNEAH